MRLDRQVDHGLRLVDPRRPVLAPRLALLDRLREEPRVEVEPDRGHVPGLLPAEDVPRAADLEVGERDLEPRAQLRGVEDRLEPLPGLLAHPLAPPVQEVRVRPPRRAAHATPELVELGEPERVRPVDDDRVRVRDVEPRLDDRRAHEDIRPAAGERDHHPLELALPHLAVTHHEPDARQHLAELLGLGLDRLDPVVDIEDLSATIELAQDRVADEPGRRLRDPGLDRQAVLGRRLDHRHVADPGEGQVERPRDRRRRQGDHVDLAPELLQALLRRDPEPLLLVDDDEPEITEPDVLRQQPMRPDHEIDRPVREPVDGRLLLGRRHEP
jgi:hypothetical protein